MENTAEVKRIKKKTDKNPEEGSGATKKRTNKKNIAAITVFVIGIATLACGLVFLVLNLLGGNAVIDGEYLVSAGDWVLTDCKEENCDKVVWDFTEIGKGKLTTDGGEHKYDFQWAIEDGKLIVQTDWLYKLGNKYSYSLDQSSGVLELADINEKNETSDVKYRFVAQP